MDGMNLLPWTPLVFHRVKLFLLIMPIPLDVKFPTRNPRPQKKRNNAKHTKTVCEQFAKSPLEAQFDLPCYALTVLDCFSEGGFAFNYEDYLAKTFLTGLLPANPYQFKPSFQGMTDLEIGQILGPSCLAWNRDLIPYNYIYGGDVRLDPSDDSSAITALHAFETVFYVDSYSNIARRIKIATGQCTYTDFYSIECPVNTKQELDDAEEFVWEWFLDFIDWMEAKNDANENDDTKQLTYVWWTPRTSSDLLTEASSADFTLLGIAYITMIIFASLTAVKRDFFLSRTEASCSGVLIVLVTVVATMGLGANFIVFSPNVVQVLPFTEVLKDLHIA